ncbi:NosD domain-containing protein, partial [Neisseria gonorrhoeae]|uniref:NosD domain-containing protein n=1 Tax=Neisseria gonorrhoeae TaxID=485 RepID=UPI003879F08F
MKVYAERIIKNIVVFNQGARDGIFSNTSTHNTYKNNRFSDLRFAVHYMYTNDSEVSGNICV